MPKITSLDILKIAAANPDVIIPSEGMEILKTKGKRNKFNAIRCEHDGIKFDSKAEMYRYFDLDILQRSGQISNLELQPVYQLPGGITYKADFRYIEDGTTVVEDVKGGKATQTRVFINKWKQVNELYPDVDWRLIET